MQVQVVTCVRQKGTGAKSGRPYDFFRVGGLLTTAKGTEYVEVMLDAAENDAPEIGKRYDVQIEFYPDREKRLSMRVVALKAPAVQKAA